MEDTKRGIAKETKKKPNERLKGNEARGKTEYHKEILRNVVHNEQYKQKQINQYAIKININLSI